MSRWSSFGIGLLVAAWTTAAGAQMGKHGFVEPCTMSNVAERHLRCELCPSGLGQRDCEERFGAKGYTKKCRTRGTGHAWDEIWCAPLPPPEKKSETLHFVLGAAGTLAAMLLLMKLVFRSPARPPVRDDARQDRN